MNFTYRNLYKLLVFGFGNPPTTQPHRAIELLHGDPNDPYSWASWFKRNRVEVMR